MRAAVDRHPHQAAITYATEQITALTGIPPRITHEPDGIRIETDVTDHLLHHWEQLLAVLELGTSFGLTDTGVGGQVAWMRFDTGEVCP
ncbi:hypothetical protein ACWD64_03315 [Streptomyces antibioticus]